MFQFSLFSCRSHLNVKVSKPLKSMFIFKCIKVHRRINDVTTSETVKVMIKSVLYKPGQHPVQELLRFLFLHVQLLGSFLYQFL